jgi:hypothetical protein
LKPRLNFKDPIETRFNFRTLLKPRLNFKGLKDPIEHRLSTQVGSVEVNALRETLGTRPTPRSAARGCSTAVSRSDI